MSGPIRITREQTPAERIAAQEAEIARLRQENVDLMLALTQLYEELLASKTGGDTA
jgi:hypothetical protein